LALAALGGSAQIGSLSDPTAEARKCSLLFDTTFRAFLRDVEWQDASARKELTAQPAAPLFGFSYQYLYPTDAVKIIRVVPTSDELNDGWDWQIGRNQSNQLVILTNAASPVYIEYTKKVLAEQLDDLQVRAFKYLLASELAIALRNDQRKSDAMLAYYRMALADAMGGNASERSTETLSGNYWNTARQRGW
jgi:hypothetical protein